MQKLSQQTIDSLKLALDLTLTPRQIEQFTLYRELLLSWNERVNLTAVRTPEGIEQTHFVDSLSVILSTGSLENCTMIDIGTGAGFPGIPLKIVYPSLCLTLVESVQKKGAFLNDVLHQLALDDVTILSERAETLGKAPDHRDQYDWAVARAVAELPILIEYLAPFCRLNGRLIAMKGPDYLQELEAAQNACKQLNVARFSEIRIPRSLSGDKDRFLIVLKKEGETPARYPRRPGMAVKRPL